MKETFSVSKNQKFNWVKLIWNLWFLRSKSNQVLLASLYFSVILMRIKMYAWKKYFPLTRSSLGLKKLLSKIFFLRSPIFHSSCFPINYENEIFLQFFSNSYSSHMLRRRKEKLKWEKSVREVWKMQTRDVPNYFMLCRVQQMFADKPFAKLFVNTSA